MCFTTLTCTATGPGSPRHTSDEQCQDHGHPEMLRPSGTTATTGRDSGDVLYQARLGAYRRCGEQRPEPRHRIERLGRGGSCSRVRYVCGNQSGSWQRYGV
jgi:hypothetical protein